MPIAPEQEYTEEIVSAGEGDIRQYLQEIRRYPLLTPQQEQELARRCAENDPEAIRQMVNANLRLVFSIAREYAGRGVPLLDLCQEGSVGLLVAAKKFDPSRNLRFSTYATKWIRHGVTACLYYNNSLVRLPNHTADRARKILATRARLEQEGREATPQLLAQECGLPEKTVRKLLQSLPEVCSLDAPLGEDGDSVAYTIANLEAPEPQAELIRQELKLHLDQLMGTLTQRQQKVLKDRYGLDGGPCKTCEELGRELGLTKERVRQIEHQALDRLAKLGKKLGLEDFL